MLEIAAGIVLGILGLCALAALGIIGYDLANAIGQKKRTRSIQAPPSFTSEDVERFT